MAYRILREAEDPKWDGKDLSRQTKFEPTGEIYDGDDVHGRLDALQTETGVCHAASALD